ncbi:MAG: hypothetical protein KAV87_31430, partial [Desulfobacteraceae bacterium]|nr:hypothetical protein [Desulfobacteraceae bacterium]
MSTIAEHEAAQQKEIDRLIRIRSLFAARENLRDQFAMAALTGQLAMLANPQSSGVTSTQYKQTAIHAYFLADAM